MNENRNVKRYQNVKEANLGWYKKTFRRDVVDMHITDDDPRFMADFDADRYVDMLVRSQVQSTVL